MYCDAVTPLPGQISCFVVLWDFLHIAHSVCLSIKRSIACKHMEGISDFRAHILATKNLHNGYILPCLTCSSLCSSNITIEESWKNQSCAIPICRPLKHLDLFWRKSEGLEATVLSFSNSDCEMTFTLRRSSWSIHTNVISGKFNQIQNDAIDPK